jgi:hypothetical protein
MKGRKIRFPHLVKVKLDDLDRVRLNALRGRKPASRFVRELIRQEHHRRERADICAGRDLSEQITTELIAKVKETTK